MKPTESTGCDCKAIFVVFSCLVLGSLALGQAGPPHSIAFHSNRDGIGTTPPKPAFHQLYAMNPDGSDQSRVTYDLTDNDQSVDISPDGTKIAFVRTPTGGHSEIYVMDADGRNVTQLSYTAPGTINAWPRWSPSGEWIAFHSGSGSGATANFQIYLIKPDSPGVMQPVTSYAGLNQYPGWAPDGTRLAIRRDNNLYLISLDASLHESSAAQLTDTPGFINQMAAFSPDGTKIAYMSTRVGNQPSVFLRSVDGGLAGDTLAVNLTPNPSSPSSTWTSRAPSWAPNGEYLYFTGKRPTTGSNEQIFVMAPVPGSDPAPLTCRDVSSDPSCLGVNSEASVRHVVPPTITSISATPSVLWPPDNNMSPVSVSVEAFDNSDPTPGCQITNVESNEPIDGTGWQITGPLTLDVLAQRLGTGIGRKYIFTVTCTNSSQLTSSATISVFVPHDQRK